MCSEQLKSSDCNNDDSCDVIPIHGTSVVNAEYLVPIYVNSNITTSGLRMAVTEWMAVTELR